MINQLDTVAQDTVLNGVAIIGMAGRFPGARNIAEFWRNLCAGVDSVTHFDDAQLQDSFGPEIRNAANFVKARPILEDVELFDAGFFGMYAREAELTDPQHRLFLEICWEAFEDAGYDPQNYPAAVGVFAGSSPNTYFLNNVCGDRQTINEFTSNYQVGCYPMLLGAGRDFLATRVSYKFNLTGPSLTVQSACSTSLLAIAKACQSLLLYESDLALAGGVSITFPQKRGYQHLEGGMVSADGTCRPFDDAASGTIFGSGAGVVLLKRLEDAMRDGDHVYALIRGSGVNNDGASKVGFTAPSVAGQAAAIQMALANAAVEARSISYVECHGTATPLGDPIEVAGLTQAFRGDTADSQFCAIGSVKSNVGHLDAAAGVTGVIKTALSLKFQVLPPTVHYQLPNRQIDFAKTPFFVNGALTPWRSAGPRRAGVSAFGVGGTNVHLIMQEAPAAATRSGGQDSSTTPQLLTLSARSAAALAATRRNLAAYLREPTAAVLGDVAYSLQVGRRSFDHRLSIVARDRDEAIKKLDGGEARGVHSGVRADLGGNVVFMFPGQGAQYPDMGRDLYEHEQEFRRHIEQCADILRPLMAEDLRELLYPAVNSAEAKQRLMSTIAAQPAIFSLEYALAQLWMSWGVRPQAMIGHSIGEFVAAVLAGVFSLQDALHVIAARGRLMQALPGGAMLAVRLAESDLSPFLPPALTIAAINGPTLCVVSGPTEAVEEFEALLASRAVVSRRLHTSHAFHSTMVEPVIEPLRVQLQSVKLSPPTIPYVSCVTGTWILPEQATSAHYWARHAREPVRFADGIAALTTGAPPILLEIGPGNGLSTLAAQTTRGIGALVVTSMQDAARERDDRDVLLESLGRLWIGGVAPQWQALGTSRARVSLPTYPFERSRHWIDSPDGMTQPSTTQDDRVMQQTPNDNRLSDISAKIAAIFEELSGERPTSADSRTTFLEMGYDSLFLTQVAQKIQSQLKVKITFRQLLGEFPTLGALAAHLVDKLPAPLTAPATSAGPATLPSSATAKTRGTGQPPMSRAAGSPATATSSAPASETAAAAGVEGIFRDQLQAMSQLINRQFEMLQAIGQGAAGPATPGSSAALIDSAAPPASAPSDSPQPSRFQTFVPAKKTFDGVISARQRQHIDALVARYTKRTAGSKRITETYRVPLADPRAVSGFRTEWKEMIYPIVCATCAGSRLTDVDGNEYVDLVNGFGQTALGHSPRFVVDAVKAQLDLGFAIGPQAELAGKVAKLFCEITGNQRMTFCNTGSEAVMAAMRIARTVTGRDKIVIFNGDYHGQFDEVLVKGVQRPGTAPRSVPVAPGIPDSAAQNVIVLPYGTAETLQWIRDNADDLAAVIVEPVQSRHPNLRPFEFLQEVRRVTAISGTAFVMDEVVTGFRVHPGGMQAVTGIHADMATYGKVVGGGLPIGVLAGNARFMDALDGGHWSFGDDSEPQVGVTFFAGTFVRHPLVLAAAWAVLNHLQEKGPRLQEMLNTRTSKLVDGLRELFAAHGLSSQIESYSSWFFFHLHDDHPLSTLLFYHLRERGIHIQDGFPCFLTTAHSDADMERIHSAFQSSLEALRDGGILDLKTAAPAGTATAAQSPAGPPAEVPAAAAGGGTALTENQMEIWLSAQLSDEASCAFNESISLRMRGALNEAALREAMTRIVARHDALRTAFSTTGEEMWVSPPRPVEYPVTDLSALAPAAAESAYTALIDADARTAFDLVNGPLLRCHLVKLGADLHAFMLTTHHIICDGWSINIIVNELSQIYAGLCGADSAPLGEAVAFSAYARAKAAHDAHDLARTEKYWLDEFRNPPQSLELPTDRPRPAIKSFSGASRLRRIDSALHQAVKKAGARHGSTLFVTLLGAFQALMGRLANQDEVVVGVPTAGQSLLEDQILVGHCVNFLPIRGSWNSATTVAEFLSTTSKRVLDTYEHQNYTFGTLVRKLALPRQAGRLPLAEIQFNLERLAERMVVPSLTIEVEPNAKAHVNFDLFLNVIESPEGLRLDLDYNTDLFDAATVDHWLDCYQALLQSFVADTNQPLCETACLPSADRSLLFDAVNGKLLDFPREATVHSMIEAQAVATPDAIAAQFGAACLTYAELNRRVNQLANHLLEKIGRAMPGERMVGVSVERSLEMLVALLAVMKSGCAYVPLDPLHPAARLRHILGEAKVAALISDGSESAALVRAGTPLIDVRRDATAIAACATSAPAASSRAEDLAYVIYTSGSTGLPKGVEIAHRSVVNLLCAMAHEPGLDRNDVFFAVTTISFDIAALELFLPLVVGAKLVIADRGDLADGFKLREQLDAMGVTAMQATPASWRLLLEAGFSAKPGFKILCGGEALPRELADRLLKGSGELWNMYGPTETTIWSSCTRVLADGRPISVGRPTANTQFYVLDKHDQLLPAGIPGQLHIGGEGVARGYYRREALTAEKFISNPFAAGRLYRTGDLARWLPGGVLQVLGRIDHQVKLRGFRIELGEIESVLTAKAQVAAVTVILREDIPGTPRIVAYYVQGGGPARSPDDLRALLAEEMPDYMIPSAWVKMTALPLSPNGKLDRAALPPPDAIHGTKQEFVAPTNPTELALTKIFAEVLKMDRVGISADLLKLGADSIQLFQITARANRAEIKITAKQLLEHRTARALAVLADGAPVSSAANPGVVLPTLGQFQRGRRTG